MQKVNDNDDSRRTDAHHGKLATVGTPSLTRLFYEVIVAVYAVMGGEPPTSTAAMKHGGGHHTGISVPEFDRNAFANT